MATIHGSDHKEKKKKNLNPSASFFFLMEKEIMLFGAYKIEQ